MANPTEDDVLVHLRITCLQTPEAGDCGPTEFGLQDRAGTVLPGQRQPDGAILHEVTVPVARREDNTIRFRGPYVQGTPTAPFLYLSLKRLEPEAGAGPWVRRLKIPLPTVLWDDVAAAQNAPVFAARVSGNRSGTVPLLDGRWIRQNVPLS